MSPRKTWNMLSGKWYPILKWKNLKKDQLRPQIWFQLFLNENLIYVFWEIKNLGKIYLFFIKKIFLTTRYVITSRTSEWPPSQAKDLIENFNSSLSGHQTGLWQLVHWLGLNLSNHNASIFQVPKLQTSKSIHTTSTSNQNATLTGKLEEEKWHVSKQISSMHWLTGPWENQMW